MEEPRPRKSSGRKRRRSTSPYQTPYFMRSDDSDDMMMVDAVEVQDEQANSTSSSLSIIIYYALLFLKVGLWITFAWVLSHLHLGAPCFLLPLTAWLYLRPMHTALKWARRRLWGPVK